MMLRSSLVIVFTLLLISCVNKDFVDFDPNLKWSASGKISVSISEFTGVYNFAVFNTNEANEIVIFSRFGIELYKVTFLSNGILVEGSLFDKFLGQSEALDQVIKTNLEFIWRSLPHWVSGKDKFGQSLQPNSKKEGWNIRLSNFSGIRPRVIILNKGDIRAKIKISRFENLI